MSSIVYGQGTQHKQLILTGYDEGHVDIWDLNPSLDAILYNDKNRANLIVNGNSIKGPVKSAASPNSTQQSSHQIQTVNEGLSSNFQELLRFQGFGGPSYQDLLRTLESNEDFSIFDSERSSQSSFL